MSALRYRDRTAAGRELAKAVRACREWTDPLVLALPRGGVPVAVEVARELDADLDVLIVRKVGLPWHAELAMGAIASGGVCIRNESVIRSSGVTEEEFARVLDDERRELARRERRYRGDRPLPEMRGRTVIVVDDGLATGSTMRAAVEAVREFEPDEVVVAVPVGARDSVARLLRAADEVVCPSMPWSFGAIGQFYDDFSQVSDGEVTAILAKFNPSGRGES